MLNRFSCIALAGVATEYLLFGCAEGGLADINKVRRGCFGPSIFTKSRLDHLQAKSGKIVHAFVTLSSETLALVEQLDLLLKGLGFTQKKADSQVRWSVLNTVLLLRRHDVARGKLAKAMSQGKSIGFCIDVLEDTIGNADI